MACIFKLVKDAEKNWKKLYGHKRIADVISLVRFVDGLPATNNQHSISA
jgi:hypothetical protein